MSENYVHWWRLQYTQKSTCKSIYSFHWNYLFILQNVEHIFCNFGFGIFVRPIIHTVWSKWFIFQELAGNGKNEQNSLFRKDAIDNIPQFDAYWNWKVENNKEKDPFCSVNSAYFKVFDLNGFFSLICVYYCGIQFDEIVCLNEIHLVKTAKNVFANELQTFSK